MMKFFKKMGRYLPTMLMVALLITSVLPHAAYADVNTQITGIDVTTGKTGVASGGLSDVNGYVQNALKFVYAIGGAVSLACFIFAGIRIGTSGGNPQKRQLGWGALGMAILAALIVGGAATWQAISFGFGQNHA